MRNETGMLGRMYENMSGKYPDLNKRVTKGFSYLKDILENLPSSRIPPEIHREGSHKNLRELLLSQDQIKNLQDLTANFETNKIYRSRIRAGSKKKKNIHPHDFVIEKTDEATNLYFVDPEISLLSKIMPNAVYLEAMRIYNDGRPAEIALFRCRSDELPDRQALKADALLEEARNLINNGGIPGFIKNEFHGEILMRVVVGQEEAVAQIKEQPGVNNRLVNKLLDGRIQSPNINGIVASHQLRLEQFERLLTEQVNPPQNNLPKRFQPIQPINSGGKPLVLN